MHVGTARQTVSVRAARRRLRAAFRRRTRPPRPAASTNCRCLHRARRSRRESVLEEVENAAARDRHLVRDVEGGLAAAVPEGRVHAPGQQQLQAPRGPGGSRVVMKRAPPLMIDRRDVGSPLEQRFDRSRIGLGHERNHALRRLRIRCGAGVDQEVHAGRLDRVMKDRLARLRLGPRVGTRLQEEVDDLGPHDVEGRTTVPVGRVRRGARP